MGVEMDPIDKVTMERCERLRELGLDVTDRHLIELILAQLGSNWRGTLVQELNRLEIKYQT